MKKACQFFWLTVIFFLMIKTAIASPIFVEDFNSENGGFDLNNYFGFSQWTVVSGSVDLIGRAYSPISRIYGYGLYLDMDGTTGVAGTIQSTSIRLNIGWYTLSYDLAGNQRKDDIEYVTAKIGTGALLDVTHSLSKKIPFTTYQSTFHISVADNYYIEFSGWGGDYCGMLLDNIQLSAIPEPNTLILLGIGLICLLRLCRKCFQCESGVQATICSYS